MQPRLVTPQYDWRPFTAAEWDQFVGVGRSLIIGSKSSSKKRVSSRGLKVFRIFCSKKYALPLDLLPLHLF